MKTLRILAGAGVAAAGYAIAEARSYRLAERFVRLPERSPSMTILHLSDTHLLPRHRRLISFLGRLPDELGTPPDLVIATGDLIEDDGGTAAVVETFGRIEAKVGRFYVLGSHDLYCSTIKGALGSWRMFAGRARARRSAVRNDSAALERGLQEKGWKSLVNRAEVVEVSGKQVRLCGTHDPYLGLHKTDHARRAAEDDLAIAAVHSPDVVSEWILAGFDLVLAGHTHAGQVRLPLLGAVVTNCSLPNALAGGLHAVGHGWLHVSPGLGTSRFTRFRMLAPPEATLLHLYTR